jgi:squalene-associated FAD-dependent desaturase
MAARRVHVVGAGLAGLAAAVALRDKAEVVVHEAGPQAGGRCRSFFDESLGATIDNGNHLMLSGNRAAMRFVRTIGGEGLEGPERAEFPFVDLRSGDRWTIRPNAGPLPWWIFSAARRAPGSSASDHLALAKLMGARKGACLADLISCSGAFYERFLRPVLVAALNTDPAIGSAALARAVASETLGRGGRACRPLVARASLSAAFVEPALKTLHRSDATVRFNHRLRRLIFAERRVGALDFSDEMVLLGPKDVVILATPAQVAASLAPGLRAPSAHNAIVNAHFMIDPPAGFPPLLGVVNAETEWIFSFPGRLSVTISDANRLLDRSREALAETIWSEVAALTGLGPALPPNRIIKEKRATFAATPDQNAKRPGTKTRWANLKLAGDWTATGLPATIEGAIRSGEAAAREALSAR